MTPEQTEFNRRWCEALRSGDYAQANGALRINDAYCCLGVALDIADPNGWTTPASKSRMCQHRYSNNVSVPDRAFFRQTTGISTSAISRLAVSNDQGSTFAEIADQIEALTSQP